LRTIFRCIKKRKKKSYFFDQVRAPETKILSYPNVVGYEYDIINQQYELQLAVMRDLKEAKEEDIENGDREFFLDFRKPEVDYHIRVRNIIKKDPNLQKRVLKVDKDHLNIMEIFIDTVSRANWHRKYHKTNEFLRQYHYLEKKNKRVYEFFRMHSIRGYTFPNLFASTYGVEYKYW
jgi:hypothetical protein